MTATSTNNKQYSQSFQSSVAVLTPIAKASGGCVAGTMTTYPSIGVYPTAIAFDGTNMWTANYGDGSVTKISPSGATTTYSGTGTSPYAIAFDGTNMWATNATVNSVTKICVGGG